jgi:DNA replication protein
MKKFAGFTDRETFSRLPDSFFHHLLAEIDTAEELKVTLFAIWRFEHMESRQRFLREKDFTMVVPEPAAALEKAVQRGSLLSASPNASGKKKQPGQEVLYFLNSPRGRAAAGAYARGSWAPGEAASYPAPETPNIFKLYEENIGPLTPLLADTLKDAENTYAEEWVAEAIEIAVKNNKRSWSYVEAILKRWKEEGHAKEQDRRDAEESRGRDVARKVEDFLKR